MRLKFVWLWLCPLLLPLACTRPQAGAHRPPLSTVYAGGVTDGGATARTCGDVVCDPNATCNGSEDAARCTCAPGFSGDGTKCTDIDECATPSQNDCDPNANCTNEPGRYLCVCKTGFLGDGKTCTGVNECQGTTNTCDPNAICIDSNPGFSCQCKPGFTGDGFGCADIDECGTPSLYSCPANAHCVNTFGGYTCACDPGFSGDGTVLCKSLCDAAETDRTVCSDEGLCRIEGHSGVCDACAPGTTGDGKTCAPSNCAAQCDGVGTDDTPHTVCAANGSCACAPGYQGTPGNCSDVNECATDNGGCGMEGACTNLDGGYACGCKPGYAPDANGACADIDECAATPGPCHPDATCTNTTPDASGVGYTCQCKPGFEGDGTVCEDIDECATNRGGCATNATCVNEPGSFSCECQAPLVGDPQNCHCDLGGFWAMRQDLSTCWKGRPVVEGTDQDLISPGSLEATDWELYDITYDGSQMMVRRQGCGTDKTPDLISPLFRETYSSYVPFATFDEIGLPNVGDTYSLGGLVPGSSFTTPSAAAVVGIDLGADPLNAPWPAPGEVADSQWLDPDGDGEPGLTFWPRVPSEVTQTGTEHYSYLPTQPAIGGNSFYVNKRAGCVSVALRVVTHLEAQVQSCTEIVGTVVNEKSEGRVHSCSVVDKGTCDPNNPESCSGWSKDITCNASDWSAATRCTDDDVSVLDDDQNQAANSVATFDLVRLGDPGSAKTCNDVRTALPAIVHATPEIACTTPQ